MLLVFTFASIYIFLLCKLQSYLKNNDDSNHDNDNNNVNSNIDDYKFFNNVIFSFIFTFSGFIC